MSAVHIGELDQGDVNTLADVPALLARIRAAREQIEGAVQPSPGARAPGVPRPPPFAFHGSAREMTQQLREQTEQLRSTIRAHQAIASAAHLTHRANERLRSAECLRADATPGATLRAPE